MIFATGVENGFCFFYWDKRFMVLGVGKRVLCLFVSFFFDCVYGRRGPGIRGTGHPWRLGWGTAMGAVCR